MTSKRHHYVPVSILKNFLVTRNSTIYLKRESAGEPKQRNINKIFFRWHYNSFERPSGQRDDRVEKFFAHELDNFIPEWQQTFEQALETRTVRFSSSQSRQRFIQFFYNHMKRTPDFTEPLVEKVKTEVFDQDLFSKIEDRFRLLSNKERVLIDCPDFQSRTVANSRVSNLSRQSVRILETLASLCIFAATPSRKNKQFIVASNPVVRFEDYPYQELGTPGVELWTTISPKLAVGFAHPERANGNSSQVIELDDFEVWKLNITMTKNSHAIASKSQNLLMSLAKSAW